MRRGSCLVSPSASGFLRDWPNGFGSPEVWKCEIPSGGGGEEHKGITKNWVQSIVTGSKLIADGTEGINGVELSNAMMLSTWNDDWVSLPVDEKKFYDALQERVANSEMKEGDGKILDVENTF